MPDAGVAGRGVRRLCWTLLAVLLAANLASAALVERSDDLHPIEASTYALQSASVAFDLDLQYSRGDYDRYLAQHGAPPAGVVLRSPDRGERIAYAVPVPYAVLSAPVVRLAPVRGLAVANALLLALAALAAAATLERRLGPTAPAFVAAFVFASVTFAYTYRASPELFAAVAVALAFALALRGEGSPSRRFTEIYAGTLPGEEAGRAVVRWLAVGLLAGTAAAFHPFYLVLLLPLGVAVPKSRRLPGLATLLAAALLALAGWGGLQAWSGGGWIPWDRGGRVFAAETGFPAVDVPVAAWPAEAPAPWRERWLPGGPPDLPLDRLPPASLSGWNLVFLAAGRHLGLLPYFLPLVLGFVAFRGERGRAVVPLAVAAACAALLWLRPFAFDAAALGSAGLGNAFFLPLYPALWFLAARPLRPAWVLLVALAAAPWVYPAWVAAATGAAGPALPSPVARRLLPLETTQTAVPGVLDLQEGALWVRVPAGTGLSEGPGDALRLAAGRRGELWIGSPIPLPGLRLDIRPGGPTQAEVAGAEVLRTVLTPDGGVVLVLDPGKPNRSHAVAWSSTPYAFYHLDLRFADTAGRGPVDFELIPIYEEP
jgi:hypothetical protein